VTVGYRLFVNINIYGDYFLCHDTFIRVRINVKKIAYSLCTEIRLATIYKSRARSGGLKSPKPATIVAILPKIGYF
jgi:hypothetical protein